MYLISILLFSPSSGQYFIPSIESCLSSQYFDGSTLTCSDCPINSLGSSQSCVCNSGFKASFNNPGTGGLLLECTQCPANQGVSQDGVDCIPCGAAVLR